MNRKMTRVGLVTAGALGASMLVGGLALGTSGSGVTANFTARGTSDDKIKSRGDQAFDVVTQDITIGPLGHTGWHSHPGQAIVVIKEGTFTTYSADDKGCTATHYPAGSVYVDRGYGAVHIARNLSTTANLVLHVTYIDVPVKASAAPISTGVRIDAANPGNCAGF